MPKIKIDYSLNNKEKSILGIMQNNKITYKDDNYTTNLIINENEIVLNRENDEIISEMNFGKKNSCKYQIKKYNKYVCIDIELLKINISSNDIEIEYKIEDELFNFKIHYEVI